MNPPPSSASGTGIPNRLSLGKLVDQSTVLLMVVIGSLILLLALLILFHENANATKGYQLRTLEYERNQELLEEEVLKMRIAQEQSLDTLQNDPKIKAMVRVSNPQYARMERKVAKAEAR